MRMVTYLQIPTIFLILEYKNYFSQLLHVHELNDIRQTEMHTTKSQASDPSSFQVEVIHLPTA
jgi:hypothetical protein